ncbi:hypothetical protein [Sinomonas flava]|uniref:hypothetical protein n=1 Tax=Sinomonas flava TaxID=496857 RepID=UPI0039A46E89
MIITSSTSRYPYQQDRKSASWEDFKGQVRRVDRDSLLIQCAAASAAITRDVDREDSLSKLGLNPWNIADVARTSLAWGSFRRPQADNKALLRLCNMNVHLTDEELRSSPDRTDAFAKTLTRMYFEQFPGQRNIFPSLSRTILLFGSMNEHPSGFSPEQMTAGWFEEIANGLTLDDYVGSVFVISVCAHSNNGTFSLEWLTGEAFQRLEEVLSLSALRQTFTEQLVTSVAEFKRVNRQFQDHVTSAQKKFAFNPLADRPFIEGVTDDPIAPWCQAIIAKALPPAIYFLGLQALGEGFARDLGHVFQHYVGRHLELISGDCSSKSEVSYIFKKNRIDSCDWFLDLPGLLVLIECKARQPIEALRVGRDSWLDSVTGSIGKGIRQLNRSQQNIEAIAAINPEINPSKPRVGLVITLEAFYVDQNWPMRAQLPDADFPVGVLSIEELESLVTLSGDELADILTKSAHESVDGVLLMTPALKAAAGRENTLLASTWDSIGLFNRIDALQNQGEAT